jgi:DNA-binding LacI/PurR family transcriptional regulator
MRKPGTAGRGAESSSKDWYGTLRLKRGADSEPLFIQVREGIRRSILDGRLKPGDALLPQRQLCSTLKINQVTATQAVGDLLREGLLRSEHGRGIFVNDVAPPEIAVIYPKPLRKLSDPGLYESMLAAALEEIGPNTAKLTYFTREKANPALRFGPAIEEILAADADLYLTVGIQNEEYLGALGATGRPVVALDAAPTSVAFDGVVFDSFRDGYLCARILLEAGHTRIAFVGHDRGAHPGDPSGRIRIPEPDTLRRKAGFEYALAQAGIEAAASYCAARLPGYPEEERTLLSAFEKNGVTSAATDRNGALWLKNRFRIPEVMSVVIMGDAQSEGSAWTGTQFDARALGLAAGAQVRRRLKPQAGQESSGLGTVIVIPPVQVSGGSVRVIGPRPAIYEYLSAAGHPAGAKEKGNS